jgi:hypothetical protein
VTVAGLDGLVARSTDGRSFTVAPRPDGVAVTAALPPRAGAGKTTLLFTRRGVPADPTRTAAGSPANP